MGADPDWFIEKKLAKTKQGLSFFDPEALAEYKRCFRNPETIHAICEDYRAAAGVDLEMDAKDFAAGPQDRMSRALCYGARPAASDATTIRALRKSGSSYADNIVAAKAVPSGHYLSGRGAGRNHRRAARVFAARAIDQIAVGLGMSRKPRTACQNKWRLIATATECAVFGKITSCLSPCGSCR